MTEFDWARGLPRGIRILLAFSGGVDSAVAAHLCRERGFSVHAVHMILHGDPPTERVRDAADALGVPLRIVDLRERFRNAVMRPCWEILRGGRTPNPCALCNPAIKFGALWEFAEECGCRIMATGHYARIVPLPDRPDEVALLRGVHREKDQSYFLFGLSQAQLARAVFPLGGMKKDDVRSVARSLGLSAADAKESQDVCFSRPGELGATLQSEFGGAPPGGEFVDEATGRIVGRHPGVHRFTIGQRKGTGVAFGRPAWISEIDAASGRVVLTTNPESLLRKELILPNPHWIVKPEARSFHAEAQIRYRSKPVPADVELRDDGSALVRFETPVRAVTPGQAAVLYDGDRLLGGAFLP